ncbi:MAG: hypothetical protein KBD23_06395 [Gammaproteobacteria bacterium]|nr:hypothetical protein [Gammaproteobacteria bacterium]MBP9729741.1 hypothetical protein [Gammaproteobacteria bacterium]
MELIRDPDSAHYVIKSYQPGRIRIHDTTYDCPVIVLAHHLIAPWHIPSFEALSAQHFEALIALSPQIVLLGTGLKTQWPPLHIFEGFIAHGIAFEVMNSAAACRTYRVLIAEGKQVAAALFP